MKFYIQVLQSGTPDGAPSLQVCTDTSRYLFGTGEGLQRFSMEHKTRLSRVEGLFLTLPPPQCGGLPGLMLTLSDMGIRYLEIHGPPGLHDYVFALRNFMMRSDVSIKALQFPGLAAGQELPPITRPDITITPVMVVPTPGQRSSGGGGGGGGDESGAARTTLASLYQCNEWAPYRGGEEGLAKMLGRTHLHSHYSSASASASSSTTYTPPVEVALPVPFRPATLATWPPSLPRLPWALEAASSSAAPAGSEAGGAGGASASSPLLPPPPSCLNSAMSYICSSPTVPGKFHPKKAIALGVKPGPLFGILSKGLPVTVEVPSGGGKKAEGEGEGAASGTTTVTITVTPSQVKDPDIPGDAFALVSCPTLDHLPSLVSHPSFSVYQQQEQQEQQHLLLAYHLGPAEVVESGVYQAWMRGFGGKTRHFFLHPHPRPSPPLATGALAAASAIADSYSSLCSHSPIHHVAQSVVLCRLNFLFPHAFLLPYPLQGGALEQLLATVLDSEGGGGGGSGSGGGVVTGTAGGGGGSGRKTTLQRLGVVFLGRAKKDLQAERVAAAEAAVAAAAAAAVAAAAAAAAAAVAAAAAAANSTSATSGGGGGVKKQPITLPAYIPPPPLTLPHKERSGGVIMGGEGGITTTTTTTTTYVTPLHTFNVIPASTRGVDLAVSLGPLDIYRALYPLLKEFLEWEEKEEEEEEERRRGEGEGGGALSIPPTPLVAAVAHSLSSSRSSRSGSGTVAAVVPPTTTTTATTASTSTIPPSLFLLFTGTGAAIPSKYRNVSGCLVVLPPSRFSSSPQTPHLLPPPGLFLDCGEGTLGQLHRAFGNGGGGGSESGGGGVESGSGRLPYGSCHEALVNLTFITISHMHADHHLGAPSLIRARSRALKREEREVRGRGGGATSPPPPLIVIGPSRLFIWLLEVTALDSDMEGAWVFVDAEHFLHIPTIGAGMGAASELEQAPLGAGGGDSEPLQKRPRKSAHHPTSSSASDAAGADMQCEPSSEGVERERVEGGGEGGEGFDTVEMCCSSGGGGGGGGGGSAPLASTSTSSTSESYLPVGEVRDYGMAPIVAMPATGVAALMGLPPSHTNPLREGSFHPFGGNNSGSGSGASSFHEAGAAAAAAVSGYLAPWEVVKSALVRTGLEGFRSVRVRHCTRAYGYRVEGGGGGGGGGGAAAAGAGGWSLVFSGDTRPCSEIVALCRGEGSVEPLYSSASEAVGLLPLAPLQQQQGGSSSSGSSGSGSTGPTSLLIHEATFDDTPENQPHAISKRHSTAGEAVRVGREGGAGMVALTHFSARHPKVPVVRVMMEEEEEEGEEGGEGGGGGGIKRPIPPVFTAYDLLGVWGRDIGGLAELTPVLKELFEEEEGEGEGEGV